jgi:hypothetical protein
MKDAVVTYQKAVAGRKIIDLFFKCWAVILPITSVLILPSVQGTTPAYIMAFLSIPLILFAAPIDEIKQYFFTILLLAGAYLTLSTASQFILSIVGNMDLSTLPLVDPLSFTQKFVLRPTLFTQSLYLSACLLTFLFVYHWYHPSWDPYIFAGILLLVTYGFYETIYFWLTGTSGDFLSNRVFNDRYFGSSTHVMNIGDISLLRMKSLTGEASMFAFTVLPYWVFAIHKQKFIIASLLTLALMLSTSTTAILGMVIYAVIIVLSAKVDWKYFIGVATAGLLVTVVKFETVFQLFNQLVLRKLSTASISGGVRISNMVDSLTFWWEAPIPVKIFGLGFGYIRSTDFFSTILVNNGLIGFLIFASAFAYPVIMMGNSSKAFALKAALIIIFCTMMIAVTEYTYLPTWLFLGIAYHLSQNQDSTSSSQIYRKS